jgi:hypothetical protein
MTAEPATQVNYPNDCYCGKTFYSPYRKSRYCSPKCRRKKARIKEMAKPFNVLQKKRRDHEYYLAHRERCIQNNREWRKLKQLQQA